MKEVLKFSASWCGPCKMLSKTIDSAGDVGVKFTEIDIDENMDKTKEFGVRGVPTMVLMEDGKELRRISGALTEAQLRKFLE